MIRVCHVITTLEVGGAQTQLGRLLPGLRSRGVDSLVVALRSQEGVGAALRQDGFPIVCGGLDRGLTNVPRIVRVVRRFDPQIIETWLYHADLFGLMLRQFTSAKLLWNLRNSYLGPDYYTFRKRALLRFLSATSRATTAVVANSRSAQEFHHDTGYAPPLWRIIPNGYDLEELRPDASLRSVARQRLGLSDNDIVFGMLARWDPVKGHQVLLQALAQASALKGNIHLVLFGEGMDGHNADLVDLVNTVGISKNVHLMGRTDNVAEAINGLDVAVSSSFGEGFPSSVAEPLACGVPIVATDVGDTADLVRGAGTIVQPRDVGAMESAVLDIAGKSRKERQRLGAIGRRNMVQLYSVEAMVESYIGLYRELLGGTVENPTLPS